ncbi:MAG TPA: TetR/AcrR family transcriptional regulator [Chloroflexota bacterium]|nr:TetR/AcrR family transcriptional regulator [Chloroflexota bacterium]
MAALASLCAERSYAATTIGEVASRAGISTRTFYKLFPGKRELFEATAASFVDELEEAVAEARSGVDSWPDEVRTGIAAILELAARKPDFARLAFVEAPAVDPALVERHRPALAEALAPQPLPPGEVADNPLAIGALGRAQVLIIERITAGRTDELPQLLPDLLFIALLPFLGHEKALEVARAARNAPVSGSASLS